MQPSKIPTRAKEEHPKHREIPVGPPPGIADEDCGTIDALVGHDVGGAFDGAPEFRLYWKPQKHDLECLNNGGVVELVILTPQLMPHYLTTVVGDEDDPSAP